MSRHCHIAARLFGHDGGAITEEGRSMRSLWRVLALQWLGGEGSEALTGDSAILEGLLEDARTTDAFDVRREPQVSRHAMMVTGPALPLDPENAAEEALRSGSPGRYSR
ncbi:MAG: hypothetical protein WCA23_23530 [Stellaceae bacterium]